MSESSFRGREPSWPDIWATVRDQLRTELGQGVFDTWIAPLALVGVDEGQVRLTAPGRLVRDYVSVHHAQRIERNFTAQSKDFVSLEILVEQRIGGAAVQPAAGVSSEAGSGFASRAGNGAAANGNGRGSVIGLWDREPDGEQSFENFVVGTSNEFAFMAAKRLAEGNEPDAGMLYLHGHFGFGKTHLLNAIALHSRKARGARPLLLRAEDFMRRFLGALRDKETLAFKEELRGFDLLLVDDLQHICGRTVTVNEFLHTVNTFTDLRRKLVIAADRPPAALDGLPDDVRSRLQGALVIALEKPDLDTRLAILKAKAAERERRCPRAALSEEMLRHIAEQMDVSPRELIGVFQNVATRAELSKDPLTIALVDDTIASRAIPGEGRVSVDEIQKKTADYYKLDVRDLSSPRRARRIARPRQVAMYLSRQLTSRSLPDIGKRFGNRDHTTVLHACRRIEELCRNDPVLRQEVEFLCKVLGRPPPNKGPKPPL